MENHILKNPPAPKVPRRGSLAARDTTDKSVRLVQLQAHVRLGQGAKSRFRAVVICTFCRSAQHRPNASNMAATLTCGQLRPNLAPTSAQLGPTWTHLEQLRAKLRSIWLQNGRRIRPNPKSSKCTFSLIFSFFASDDASFEARFSMLCLCWAQLGVKLSRPSWAQVGSCWAQVGSCSAQLKAKDGQVWHQSAFGWAN